LLPVSAHLPVAIDDVRVSIAASAMHPSISLLATRCSGAVILGLFCGSCAAMDAYGGAWSVRAESDVKASFSWIGSLGTGNGITHHAAFIEPMIGVSGSGIYLGYEYKINIGRTGNHSFFKIRPKLGFLRTYNDPWTVDDKATYAYGGIEVARTDLIFGLNGHFGFLARGGDLAPSFGIGFGF